MPQPKSKISRSRRGMRRSHDAISAGASIKCPNCGALARPHRACASCGHYKGKEVITAKD